MTERRCLKNAFIFFQTILSFVLSRKIIKHFNWFSMIAQFALLTLYKFKHWVFLVLDNVFSYYNKDTWINQNKVIIKRNIIFRFTLSCVSEINTITYVEQVVSIVKKQITAYWKLLRHLEAIVNIIYKGFCCVFGSFFCQRITGRNW